MNDWGLSVLSRYPVTVRGTKKVRGALLCDTADGLYLLQEYHGSERRLQREAEILEFTAHRGGYLTDVIIPDEEGRLWNRNEEGNRYVLKRWYPYPECSAQSRSDVSQAVRLLARLHLLLRRVPEAEHAAGSDAPGAQHVQMEEKSGISAESGVDAGKGGAGSGSSQSGEGQKSLFLLYEKHTRELRRAAAYLKRKKKKTPLEEWIMKSFDGLYRQAVQASEQLERSAYESLRAKAEEEKHIYHGSYHQHNVLVGSSKIASVNYERYGVGLQLTDLYQFMRKILEKHNWNQDVGRMMLEEYERILPLLPEERQVLAGMFSYPEKYWKQINFYLNSSKVWTPDKNVEKLKQAIGQADARVRFVSMVLH